MAQRVRLVPFLQLQNGARLYYEAHGSGPAIVFAHGLGGCHLSWWQQVPHFRERYTCVVFSHRGFGLSSDSEPARGAESFADDMDALIEQLALPDVRIVAQSMGGWTSLAYTLRHPERVRALVMAATTGAATSPALDAIYRQQALAGPTPDPDVHPAVGSRMAAEQPGLSFLYRELDALSGAVDKESLRRQLGAMRTTPVEATAGLKTPILCITGEEDIVVPPAAVEVFASLVPNARLERVPEAGHSVYFERPDVFNKLVEAFLADIDSAFVPG